MVVLSSTVGGALRTRGRRSRRTGAASRRRPPRRPRTSTSTSAPSWICGLISASAMPLRRVGENVPEVTWPTGMSWVSRTLIRGRAMPRPCATRPRRVTGDPASFSASQRVPAPERRLGPADGPAEPALVGRHVQADVLAVQRVAHLGAQRVAGTEAARRDPLRPRLPPAARPTVPAPRRCRRPARSRAHRCTRCGTPTTSWPSNGRSRTTCSRDRSAGRAPTAPRRTSVPGPPARRGSRAGR